VKDSFTSYPLDRLALAGAVAAFEDKQWFEDSCSGVIRERKRVTEELERRGFEVLPSKANFVFARHPDHEGSDVAAKLREQGGIVRHFNKPRISDFLRITIGTSDQNNALIKGLDSLYAGIEMELGSALWLLRNARGWKGIPNTAPCGTSTWRFCPAIHVSAHC